MDTSLMFIHGYESKPYAGPLRPFINWGEELVKKNLGIDLTLILFKSDPEIIEAFPIELRERTVLVYNLKELLGVIQNSNPKIIMSDDHFPRLKLLEKIKEHVKAKTIIYIQFLYGIHSISNCFYYTQISFMEKLLYKTSSLVPYKLLTSKYVKMLKRHDIFISNSKTSKNLFFWLYNIHVDNMVYPPINTNIFKSYGDNDNTDSNKVLIYLGSSGGDVNLNFLHQIIKTVVKKDFKVNCFGNERLGKIIEKIYGRNVRYYKILSDIELAKLYSSSLITICPQIWELFGYTAIESMACGTPVLAFNYFGPSETIVNEETGIIANTKHEFIDNLKQVLDNHIKFNRSHIRKYAIRTFSAEKSANKLRKVIERTNNHEFNS